MLVKLRVRIDEDTARHRYRTGRKLAQIAVEVRMDAKRICILDPQFAREEPGLRQPNVAAEG